MRHGSLFSGIGGFDLAAQWMGWENVFQVEKDGFCQKVLAKNFPNTARYGDIKEFDGTKYRGAVDIITGGFPCQPFSSAGKRRGTKDDRYLWPEMLRVIRQVQPSYIVGENVYGIVNWSKGLVFEQVCSQLENEGYAVQPVILPAASVQAPHERYRTWFVAHALRDGCNGTKEVKKGNGVKSSQGMVERYEFDALPDSRAFTDSASLRWFQGINRNESGFDNQVREANAWERFPTQSPIRSRNDGISSGLVRSTIHAAGNAIVPQVAYEIFKAIEQVYDL